ncbi:MAG: hypothetical protein ACQEQN_02285, partial [Thermodesulfobacteriota bacterium]
INTPGDVSFIVFSAFSGCVGLHAQLRHFSSGMRRADTIPPNRLRKSTIIFLWLWIKIILGKFWVFAKNRQGRKSAKVDFYWGKKRHARC